MIAQAKSWWNQPYQEGMTVPKWFLFVGLLTICGIIWAIVIKHLTD